MEDFLPLCMICLYWWAFPLYFLVSSCGLFFLPKISFFHLCSCAIFNSLKHTSSKNFCFSFYQSRTRPCWVEYSWFTRLFPFITLYISCHSPFCYSLIIDSVWDPCMLVVAFSLLVLIFFSVFYLSIWVVYALVCSSWCLSLLALCASCNLVECCVLFSWKSFGSYLFKYSLRPSLSPLILGLQ